DWRLRDRGQGGCWRGRLRQGRHPSLLGANLFLDQREQLRVAHFFLGGRRRDGGRLQRLLGRLERREIEKGRLIGGRCVGIAAKARLRLLQRDRRRGGRGRQRGDAVTRRLGRSRGRGTEQAAVVGAAGLGIGQTDKRLGEAGHCLGGSFRGGQLIAAHALDSLLGVL